VPLVRSLPVDPEGNTVAGTEAEAALSRGFQKTELTTGPANEGAVSTVMLSLGEPLVLPLDYIHRIAAIEVEFR
jgi:hypothetical protein